jgi:glycosyltransferase involved in cell wall biosynthesis
MRVSVIIPCFNQGEYLGKAIESALSQTVECEVIVVIDGSEDNALEVAQSYEPQVKVIQQVNKGLASARNTGIMNSTGEFIFPLDADDFLVENAIEILLSVADATGADVIAPSLQEFGVGHALVMLGSSLTEKDFKQGNRVGYFSLIRKECLLEVGGYSPRMDKGWEDYHLWFDLLHRGKQFVTVAYPLVFYRTKENSMWTESKKHEKELWAQIYKDFPHLKDL